ncbi:MAG: PTS sugar transporter subunit IIA [Planctomycetota bacterium]|nr:PTS sugar transporter subunit IIA [Planctomycetota bacterium]MDA1024966.1 PTS sugar transporter subunit IIA [Planctomycetota bacterium]
MAFDLTSILKPELIKVPLDGETKRTTIDELCDLVCTSSSVTDPENFRKTVWEREGQRSTGIGEGLAIPHGKCPGVREITMAIGIPSEPLEFDSIDGEPVRMIVLLASPADRIADHIQALGRISKFMSDPTVRSRAYSAECSQDLYQLLAGLDAAART